MRTFFIGVDLGQAHDTTGIAVLESTQRETGRMDVSLRFPFFVPGRPLETIQHPELENIYAVRHLERLGAGTPYPVQVARVGDLRHELLKLDADVTLIVDQTGTGKPVTDIFRRAGLEPEAAILTAADIPSYDGDEYRIPRRDLVSSAQILLQSQRLTIARGLPLAETLISELLAFKATITLQRETGSVPSEPWRVQTHDDLVLAVALAAWYGENGVQRRSLIW